MSDQDSKQLLFNLRKVLSLKRKSPKENGVILIKEPVKTEDKDIEKQPYRPEGYLRTLAEFYYAIHIEDHIHPKKITKQSDLTLFPKQLVLIGQYNPIQTIATN